MMAFTKKHDSFRVQALNFRCSYCLMLSNIISTVRQMMHPRNSFLIKDNAYTSSASQSAFRSCIQICHPICDIVCPVSRFSGGAEYNPSHKMILCPSRKYNSTEDEYEHPIVSTGRKMLRPGHWKKFRYQSFHQRHRVSVSIILYNMLAAFFPE